MIGDSIWKYWPSICAAGPRICAAICAICTRIGASGTSTAAITLASGWNSGASAPTTEATSVSTGAKASMSCAANWPTIGRIGAIAPAIWPMAAPSGASAGASSGIVEEIALSSGVRIGVIATMTWASNGSSCASSPPMAGASWFSAVPMIGVICVSESLIAGMTGWNAFVRAIETVSWKVEKTPSRVCDWAAMAPAAPGNFAIPVRIALMPVVASTPPALIRSRVSPTDLPNCAAMAALTLNPGRALATW